MVEKTQQPEQYFSQGSKQNQLAILANEFFTPTA